MKIVSLFSGCGGLDLGFSQAGFDIVWANEYDRQIWRTYEKNHVNTYLDKRSILDIDPKEIPNCDGVIGGPPCQSWSEAGALRGIDDQRGQLFFNFIAILREKQPYFFVAENVSGMLMSRHRTALATIITMFKDCGYQVQFKLLEASEYGVPQTRKRVFFVGFKEDLKISFSFPTPITLVNKITLADAIYDLKDTAVPAKNNNDSNKELLFFFNHEYMIGGFSSIYMSRNRVRNWDEVSFTIQAGGRHAPIHPQAPKMELVCKDKRIFKPGKEHLYRRLTVRECARIQTFPDDFIFYYDKVSSGYKMVGNAVPVRLANVLAEKIINSLSRQNLRKHLESARNP